MRADLHRLIGGVAVAGAALLLAGCGGSSRSDDELSRDLALAASDGLAPPAPAASQVVSAVEAGPPTPKAEPKTRRAPKPGAERPRKVVAPVVSEEATETVYEPSPEPVIVAEVPEPTTTAPIPTPARRPVPVPVSIPAGEGDVDGGGHGGGLGGVIGVVIRGGSIGDDDHCEIHRPGRGTVGVLINDRLPTGTFPRDVRQPRVGGGGRFPRF